MNDFNKDTKNKEIKRKPNIKTGIAERVNVYHKIIGVKSHKEFIKKHGDLTNGFRKCLEIIFNTKFQGGSKKKRTSDLRNQK